MNDRPDCWRCMKQPRPTEEGAQVLALCERHLRDEVRRIMGLPEEGAA